MREFTDSTGQTWSLNVTVGSVARVREQSGILLPSIMDNPPESVAKFLLDDVAVGNALWGLCSPQAVERGVTKESFLESLGGDSLGAAQEALVRATIDFFTSPERREGLHKLMEMIFETGRKYAALATSEAATELDKIDSDQLARECLNFVTNGRELPPSNPTTAPLANSA